VFSPDGKWLAYAIGTNSPSTADVNRGIFIQPIATDSTKQQVPRQVVDFHPVWWKSELVFTAAATAGLMTSIPVITDSPARFGAPVQFPATVTGDRLSRDRRAWDIMPDGRVIGIVSDADNAARSATTELRVVLNWFEELKQRVPVQ